MSRYTRKIGFFGLDASGKTSFLKALDQDCNLMTYSYIASLKPTKGIERKSFDVLGEDVVVWDYGGQDRYRKRYFASETDLKGLSFAFFLLDIQDKERFEVAISYFKEILEIADLDETRIAVCLHKADPYLLPVESMQDNLSHATMLLRNTFPEATSFFQTSIYDESSLRRAFSFGIQKSRQDRKKIEKSLEEILRKTGGLIALLFNSQPLILGSVTLDSEHLETVEKLGLVLAVGWAATSATNSELKNMVADVQDGKVLFLGFQMHDQPAFLLTYSPRLPEDSFEGWLTACDDELIKLGIQRQVPRPKGRGL